MKHTAGRAILLSVLVWVVFANTLSNDFVFDDISVIKNNPAIRNVKYVKLYFLRPFFSIGQPTTGPVAYDYYRPLALLSFLADYSAWGLSPVGYHLTNVLLHMTATLLVFFLLKKLRLNATASFLAALLFAAHPALADSVAGVSGRSDPLCAIFFLAGCLCYVSARQTGPRMGILLLLAAYAACTLALLTKETAIALPIVLAAYEFTRPDGSLRRKPFSGAWALAPVFLVALLYFLWRSHLIPGSFAFRGDLSNLVNRMMTAFEVAATYARIAVLPYGLGFETFTPLETSLLTPATATALLLLLLAGRTAIKLRKKGPHISFFICWFLACLLPYAYFFLFHPEPSFFTPPHFLYFPMVGAAALCGLLLTHIISLATSNLAGWRKTAVKASPALILLFFCSQTVLRNTQWRDDPTFFSRMVKHGPTSARIHIGMGSVFLNAGQPGNALGEYARAYELAQSQSGVRPASAGRAERGRFVVSNAYAALALAGMGDAYATLGETRNSIESYRMALSENAFDSRINVKLARAYERAGRFDDAIDFYARALRLDKRLADAAASLEVAQVKKEVYDEAKRIYTIALLSHQADSVEAVYCEALMLRMTGKQEAAAALLRKVVEKAPSHFGANLALGQILSLRGEYDTALGNLSVAYAVRPTSAVAAYEMALATLALRDTLTAEMWAARAYELEPDSFYRRFHESIQERGSGRGTGR
ncbi:tetratricopeptide repeat protein [Candidatus Poribacteria bacterium]|nr:tetratricopeptide repeat protein [Candidatus Poribacteria bacterium]